MNLTHRLPEIVHPDLVKRFALEHLRKHALRPLFVRLGNDWVPAVQLVELWTMKSQYGENPTTLRRNTYFHADAVPLPTLHHGMV